MSKKQSFVKGTAILICANAVSKILGAILKIPLTYFLKEDGMAIYNTAFGAYAMLLSFVISGMPLAISKMTAEQTALADGCAVRKIMSVTTLLLAFLGILGSCVLWFGADFFACSAKEPKAVFCLKVISPSIFFVAFGVAQKSYFQGIANMTPTAVSQVTEAFVKLGVGFFLALIYSKAAAEYTAAAAITGVTVGEIIATFILFVLYLPHRFSMPKGKSDKSSAEILKSAGEVALPSVLASAASGAMNLADISIIRRCLENIRFSPEGANNFLRLYSSHTAVFDSLPETLRISRDGSRWLYGAYSGYALTVFHLPIGILASLGVSVLPVISGAIAVKNFKKVNSCVNLAVKLTMLTALPSAFGIALFSEPILDFLFGNTASSQMLAYLSPCLVFISLTQIYCAVLNACGCISVPLIFGFVGETIKLACNFVFIQNQRFNILGTVVSANISYFIGMFLTLVYAKKKFLACFDITNNLLKPLFCTIFAIGVMRLVYTPFTIIFASSKTALILSGFLGLTAYALMIVSSGCVSHNDMLLLKKG